MTYDEFMKNNVLIINSNDDEASEIRSRLINSSTDAYIATTIQMAQTLFFKYNFCLIILDACMSEEDDHKLLRSMRLAKSTPIMVLS